MRGAGLWMWPFAVALGLAAVTRLYFRFDGLYGQGAFAYFRYARALWPHLAGGAPLPDLYWPIGYPITVALLLPLSNGSPAAGQWVSALSCAWAAAATSLLVRKLGPRRAETPGDPTAAIVAGLTVAVSGAVLRYGQVVMSDPLAMGATATALLCAVEYVERHRGVWLFGCALALAWGVATRWIVGLLALPIGAFLIMHWVDPAAAGTARGRAWPWALAASLAAVGILIPVLLIAHSAPMSLERHEWLQGWSLRNVLARDFHTPEGHAAYRLPTSLFYLARLGWPDYFFPIQALFAALGGCVLLRERRWRCAALLLGWPAMTWLFLSGIPYENPRFLLPTLPAIGALLGVGFESLRRQMVAKRRWLLTAILAAGQLSGLYMGAREHSHVVAHKNADRDLVAWTKTWLPPSAHVLMVGPSLAFQYYGSIAVRDLFSASTSEIDGLVSSGAPLFLLADVDAIEARSTGLAIEEKFDALRRAPGLVVVGARAPYTLFRVGSE